MRRMRFGRGRVFEGRGRKAEMDVILMQEKVLREFVGMSRCVKRRILSIFPFWVLVNGPVRMFSRFHDHHFLMLLVSV